MPCAATQRNAHDVNPPHHWCVLRLCLPKVCSLSRTQHLALPMNVSLEYSIDGVCACVCDRVLRIYSSNSHRRLRLRLCARVYVAHMHSRALGSRTAFTLRFMRVRSFWGRPVINPITILQCLSLLYTWIIKITRITVFFK